jgi:hypothetical protein
VMLILFHPHLYPTPSMGRKFLKEFFNSFPFLSSPLAGEGQGEGFCILFSRTTSLQIL